MDSSSVISPEDVLETLMNDGTMDALRSKIINQLKANICSFIHCLAMIQILDLFIQDEVVNLL